MKDVVSIAPLAGRLLDDGQIVRGLDHRFALSKPALPSAPSKKSFSSVSSPILACSDFTSTAGCAAPLPPPAPNTSAAPSSKPRLPGCDLIGVDVELLRKLSQSLIALQGRKRHLRLEDRRVVPARLSVHGFS
jgi:hypothetical protein